MPSNFSAFRSIKDEEEEEEEEDMYAAHSKELQYSHVTILVGKSIELEFNVVKLEDMTM